MPRRVRADAGETSRYSKRAPPAMCDIRDQSRNHRRAATRNRATAMRNESPVKLLLKSNLDGPRRATSSHATDSRAAPALALPLTDRRGHTRRRNAACERPRPADPVFLATPTTGPTSHRRRVRRQPKRPATSLLAGMLPNRASHIESALHAVRASHRIDDSFDFLISLARIQPIRRVQKPVSVMHRDSEREC